MPGGLPDNVAAMTKYTLFLRLFLAVYLTASVQAGTAQQEPCKDACGKPTSWQDFNSFSLKVVEAGQREYALYQGKFDKTTGDMQFDVEEAGSGSPKKGKILMVGGRVMATQGPITEPGYEIDALDGVVLQYQLLIKALGRALPDGPKAVESSLHVDHADSKAGIEIATPSASGMMQAPWRVVGELKRIQPDTIEYDLNFTSAHGRQSKTLAFTGRLYHSSETKIEDQMGLADWKLFGVGPQSQKRGNTTTFDYSAAPETTSYKTVADIRKKLAADDYPGEPDSSKDFTGFWKADCEDAFGLQIKHFGADGKYSITFCGPGGCMDPENEGRKTFINKDPHYQVVSEQELKTQTNDGGWKTYHRCTKETNPVLKYKK
jgi:hypothetical protein